jgi:2C-methyl-D-erythritol 2,4-cyclodiphosphate synthase
LKQLEKYISKGVLMKATKLTQKRVYHRAGIDVEVLYNSPKLYQWVRSFIAAINAHSAEFDPLLMDCVFA